MASSSKIKSVVIEPGNATRYDLDVIDVGDRILLVVLYQDRQRLTGVSMKFFPTMCYAPRDTATKMGSDIAGAGVILAYLRNEYDLCVDLDTTFNQDTGVWTGATLH